jgi:phosphoenolpyruvate carboxykinase (ATP)
MNNLLDIKTPTQGEAGAVRSDFGLENHGLQNLGNVYWNLPTPALYEEVAFRREGRVVLGGALVVSTGKHTGRAAGDKFVVREPSTEEHVWWGQYNRPFSPDKFEALFARLQGYLQGRDLFVQDCYAGADLEFRMPVRILTEYAWHSLFARNMFILPRSNEEYRRHVPDFTVIAVPGFKGIPQIDATATNTFIVLNFDQRLCIIGNTAYAGEIKKSIFTVLNYLLPLQGVMPMHCSANIGPQGDAALFFGLSGTGKTTLSADPGRALVGDDEHGWSDRGVFNFEGGCYAKVIQLSPAAEPQIYACTRRFGTILENVTVEPVLRTIDLDDESVTENTRASYPLEFIDNAKPDGLGGHPKNIILLTCDANGVMPPIARLTPDQALYQFISGYTSKLAGTEAGLGAEPEMTFSACFGGPFMVHHPYKYAELLKLKMLRYGATCWLVNTGWVGGPYGVGKRISIRYTRALLNAALSGELAKVEYRTDPIFGFEIPKSCPEVPDKVLNPAESWPDPEAWLVRYKQLAGRFVDNFKKFEAGCTPEVIAAGPKVKEGVTAPAAPR